MTGRVMRQSRQRLLKCPLSRSDGHGQGRRQPASSASALLTARRRGGYPILTLVLTQPATRVRFDGGNSTYVIQEIRLRDRHRALSTMWHHREIGRSGWVNLGSSDPLLSRQFGY